jgi:hypothetical protein
VARDRRPDLGRDHGLERAVNLFNLAPIPPLDGGAVWGQLSRGQQWLLAGVVAALVYLTGEGFLMRARALLRQSSSSTSRSGTFSRRSGAVAGRPDPSARGKAA